MANRGPPKRNSNRYFDEIGSATAPGNLSKELRKALNLGDDMLPIWIYKMRVLGYPPGWCLQAEIQPNLDIIGDDQAKTGESSCEDGEIQPIIYDESATIQYPGYNANFAKNVKDDWLLLGYPPFMPSATSTSNNQEKPQSQSSKSSNKPKSKDATGKKPSSASSTASSQKDTGEIVDDTSTEASTQVIDPQEEAVEEKTTEEVSQVSTEVISSDGAVTEEVITVTSEISLEVNPSNTTTESVETTPTQKRKITVIQSESADSYQFKRKKLPDLAKWAEGMTGELLNFENLPNSTGNFSKIRGILTSFRNNNKATATAPKDNGNGQS